MYCKRSNIWISSLYTSSAYVIYIRHLHKLSVDVICLHHLHRFDSILSLFCNVKLCRKNLDLNMPKSTYHIFFLENHYLDKLRSCSKIWNPKFSPRGHFNRGKKNVFNLREVVEDFNTMTFIAPLRPIQKMLLLR